LIREDTTYNPQTHRAEPLFADWEDLPMDVRGQFKKAPGGGFVAADAEDDVEKAYYMALGGQQYRDRATEQKKSSKESGGYFAGRGRTGKTFWSNV